MKDLGESVKELLNTASKKDKYFLGRNPSLKHINKELLNFELIQYGDTPIGSRINAAETKIVDNSVIGYNSFMLMNKARATPYEREFIDMGNGLDYFYFKKIFVHPEFRKKGIATEFIKNNLNVATKFEKHSIADVEKDNYVIANILLNHNFQEDYSWVARNGMKMVRYFHE